MIQSLISILSRLPIRVLYWVADWMLYPLIYYVVRYRRKVVDKNLLIAFPQHTATERKRIARDFYHQFCNTIVEIIYGYRCSDEEMRERVVFENTEEVNRLVEQAGGGIFMLAHMGNWEWMASIQQWLNTGVTEANVYRRLKNQRDSQESSPTPQFKSISSLALSLLHSPTLTSIHDHRKNHSLD